MATQLNEEVQQLEEVLGNTGIDDDVEEDADENLEAYGTMRPFQEPPQKSK